MRWFPVGLLLLGLLAYRPALAGTTECISVSSEGQEANGRCDAPVSMSADGRYVVFASEATNLAPGSDGSGSALFLRDRLTGETRRIATGTNLSRDSLSDQAHISADGRFVVFTSAASDLVPNDTNGALDVFEYDVATGATTRVSATSSGEQLDRDSCEPQISADGRYLVFESEATNLPGPGNPHGIYLRDMRTGEVTRESIDSQGQALDVEPCYPAVSDDGRYVAFSAFVPGPVQGQAFLQLFRRDRQTGETKLLSMGVDGMMGKGDSLYPVFTAEGQCLAFQSYASNLAVGDLAWWNDIFTVDCTTGAITRESAGPNLLYIEADSISPQITPDGRFLAFSSGGWDLLENSRTQYPGVYVRDRTTLRNYLVSAPDGAYLLAEYPALSADGRFVAFAAAPRDPVTAQAAGPAQVYLRDRQTFLDVPVTAWSYGEIDACAAAGLVSGYPDGTYHPADPVTRDQMAIYISRALAGGEAKVPTAPAAASFTDVPTDYWAFKYIEYAKSKGIVSGYTSTQYAPTLPVTRDQMAVFVARSTVNPTGDGGLASYTPPATPDFSDVPADFWAYKYIEYIKGQSITGGYPDGLYHPELVVTRDQMAVYVARAFKLAM